MSTDSENIIPPVKPNAPPMPGVFGWNELNASDREGAAKFYCEVMGWGTVWCSTGGQECVVLTQGEYGVGGIVQNALPEQRSVWIPYAQVVNVEATLAKAVAAGGKVVWPVMDVPNIGRIGVFEDLQGAMLGVFQPPMQPPQA